MSVKLRVEMDAEWQSFEMSSLAKYVTFKKMDSWKSETIKYPSGWEKWLDPKFVHFGSHGYTVTSLTGMAFSALFFDFLLKTTGIKKYLINQNV